MNNYLFYQINGSTYFQRKVLDVANEISNLTKQELENSDDSLKIILKSKHQIKEIEFEKYYMLDLGEVDINVRNDPRFNAYFWRDVHSYPVYNKGKRLEIHLPFNCDYGLFSVIPSTYSTTWPSAEIFTNELVFNIDFMSDIDKPKDVENKIQSEIGLIERYAGYLNKDIQEFNKQIEGTITFNLQRRREKIQKDEEFMEGLNIPVKREKIEFGFIKPEKKLQLRILEDSTKENVDPSLELQTYDEIIKIINSFGINLERSSQQVRELGEEPLRDTFLSALNSVYQGMASGEAFNRSGKTDILLKYKDSVLFVAECKIWQGDAYFIEGIKQLLNYLTWRDSRTSYIIFSKNENISRVIEKSKELLTKHGNFIRKDKEISESSTRYIFQNIADIRKELYLTLHVFNLR